MPQGTYLALHRLNIEDTDHDTQPIGSLELVHEQPVFGTIKDIQSLSFRFGEEEKEAGKGKRKEGEERATSDMPRLGYLPKDASPTVLVVTSDSGLLSFITFHSQGERGYFHILKEVRAVFAKFCNTFSCIQQQDSHSMVLSLCHFCFSK